MSKSFKEITQDLNAVLGKFRAAAPDTMTSFNALSKSAMRAGAVDALHKELMETLEVAVYMRGGPSLMYAAEAIRAYEEFTA